LKKNLGLEPTQRVSLHFISQVKPSLLLGEREVFDNQKWNFVPKEEYYKLPKLEANAWIIVYNLFMDAECRKKYEINEHRKNNLLRVSWKSQNIHLIIPCS